MGRIRFTISVIVIFSLHGVNILHHDKRHGDAMTTDLAQYDNACWNFFSQISPDGFEKSECPMGCKSYNTLFTKKMMQIVRCECGLIYNRNQPTKLTLDKFYTESDALKKWSEIKCNPCEDLRQINKFGKSLDYLRRELGERGPRAALDLGCGNGFYLKMLKKTFPLCMSLGVDKSKDAVDKAKQRNDGVTYYCGDFGSYIREGGWDVISLWGVLEHLKSPKKVLKEIAEKKPCYIISCVPNMDALVVEHLWEYCSTFVPQHLWYFNLKTLKDLYASINYEVSYFYTVWGEEENQEFCLGCTKFKCSL